MRKFDWSGLMAVGLRRLRLQPAEFWQLTPAELLSLTGMGAVEAPLGRARLEELARKFPDKAEATNG